MDDFYEQALNTPGELGQKVSKYNSGMAQIMRLDELWKDSHRHSRAGELTKWNWDLDRVWTELAGDLKIDDKREAVFKEFTLNIGILNQDFVNKLLPTTEYARKMYQLLLDKEIFLRRLQNELGKGTKFIDADEDDFE